MKKRWMVDGTETEAVNDYEAAKNVFKTAVAICILNYTHDKDMGDIWLYKAKFMKGSACFIVRKLGSRKEEAR